VCEDMKEKMPLITGVGMVILITGATRGIGYSLATELSRRGNKVFGAGRSWNTEDYVPFIPLNMDITSDKSVEQGVRMILDEYERIDVLICNAGISNCGTVEDTPLGIAGDIFDTNYFGTVRPIRAVLPSMRKAGKGTIACISSAGGKIGIPFQSHYAASKFALEGFAESLWQEIKPLGIRVLLIEPGDVGTDIWKNTKRAGLCQPDYVSAMERFLAVKEKEMGSGADSPDRVAVRIANIIRSGGTKLRHPVARGASFILAARKMLPDSIFLRLVASNYGGRFSGQRRMKT
jgi:NAD(P)-dependent dehydrogenase (short-subunit alcohol dehydrogenase family)